MTKKKIQIDGDSFEELINELLNDLRNDLEEVDENVSYYKVELTKQFGIERVGTLFNDALKIKGTARDRMLKIIQVIRDRVKAKEIIEMTNKDKGDWTAEEIKGLKEELSKDDDDDE